MSAEAVQESGGPSYLGGAGDRPTANDKAGVRITWLTRGKVIDRFLAAPFRKRDVFE